MAQTTSRYGAQEFADHFCRQPSVDLTSQVIDPVFNRFDNTGEAPLESFSGSKRRYLRQSESNIRETL